jgi:hypothetical protein
MRKRRAVIIDDEDNIVHLLRGSVPSGSYNELLNGMTINISDGGLCLKLAVPLMTRQTLHIETTHPIIVCRTASVQWVSRKQDGSYLRGLTGLFE